MQRPDLDAPRGILNGALISIVLWLAIGAALVLAFRVAL